MKRDYNADTEYLKNIIPTQSHEFRRVVQNACSTNLAQYPESVRSESHYHDGEHRYGPSPTFICNGTAEDAVFGQLRGNGIYSAPTLDSGPVFTGKVDSLLPLDDMIVRLVDDKRRTIFNVTLPHHVLFPGYVRLQVVGSGGSTFVEVTGMGKGNLKYVNMFIGPRLFHDLLVMAGAVYRAKSWL
jgi:hypothetical protein